MNNNAQRRKWMAVAGSALGFGLVSTHTNGSMPAVTSADLVVLDANVLTVAAKHPHAEAFAVRDGRFIAVGRSSQMRPWIGPNTTIWQLQGRTITPGFNDAHLHPAPVYTEDAPQYVVPVGPDHVHTIDELVASLRHKAAITPKGQILRGFGYDDIKLGRHPTCHDLDLASTDHPIVIRHASGHLSVCNSYALKAAGITRDTPSPAGGIVGKDAQGEPNGYLAESAAGLIARVGDAPPRPDPAELLKGYAACFEGYAAKGITSVGVAGTDSQTLNVFETLRDQGRLPTRLNVMLRESEVDMLATRLKSPSAGSADGMIRLGAVKIFHGNSLSGRTCWLSEPYVTRYVDHAGYYGVPPARSQENLDALIWRIHHAGLQVACHSNGDREIEMVTLAIERAQQREPRPEARHRIEHCSVVRQDLLLRIKRAHIVIVPHSYEWEHGDKMAAYGEKRWDWMHPSKRGVELGIPVAGHSDSPISAADPMLRLFYLVTRQSEQGNVYGASQCLKPEAALRIWTLGGAYASSEERDKGSIEAGKRADFVVLASDPTRVSAQAIRQIVVERTVLSGKTIFERTRDSKRLAAYAPGFYPLCGDGGEADEGKVWPSPQDDQP